jgi:hypothetical protein
VVSSIGLVAFVYGKRQQRLPHVITGVLLMGFPYFVPSVPWIAGIAAALVAALWLSVRLGL